MSAHAADKRASFARRAESLVERKYNINTEKCGDLTVIVQGDLSQQEKRAVFITVHDLGCNHNSFQEFVSSPCMTEIKERSCFIHVDVPGHADNAEALAEGFPFPSLQSLGEDLVTVLDYLHVKYVIGLGEGAGANVLARFGLAHPSRALGLILINATGSAASVLQSFKSKFISWKSDEVAQSAESFLMYHKFGHQIVGENPDKDKIVAEYQKRLHRSLNSKNVGLYVKAFMNRKDLTLKGCKVDVILITGMLSPYASMVEKLHRDVEKERVTILKIERAGDVLADAPGKVAQSILLFCKGQGLLTSVVMPGVDRGRAFSTASSGSFESANGSRRLSRGISMEDYDKPNIRRLSIMNREPPYIFNHIYMDAPPPTKPPRGVKYGKDESAGCGFLVNVIKSLGFSETTEERQKEKLKIEQEFKRSDLRLNELVSRHDQQLTLVLPLFSQVSTEVTASRERIHAVKENLGACKRLLQCRRDELKKMWTDAVQHKYVLEMLEQIQELRKVPQRVVSYTAKRQYLHASKALTDAIATLNGPLQAVEGLSDLRADLQTRRQQLYQRLHEELVTQVYTNSANEAFSSFQRTNSSRLNSSFTRGIGARRSTDRIEANARVRKALAEMAQCFDLDKAEIIEDADLIYPELSMSYFVAIIVESFGMLHKVPDSLESLRVQIQTELLNVVRHTTHQLSLSATATGDSNPLLMLLEIIFKQFKAIAKTHALLLKNYLSVGQKYSVVGPQPYDLTDFWAQAQSVLQLLLTDYLDIQNAASDESAQTGFTEPTSNINSFFLRRKVPSTKRCMFKFDKSSHVGSSGSSNSNNEPFKEHRRNASDASVDDNLSAQLGGSGKGSTSGLFPHAKKQREKLMICTPDQNIITKVYLPLMGYIKEIENFMKCKPGQPCSLHDFVDNYIKDSFLSKGHNRNLQLTIESLSKNQDAWRTIISPEEMKALNLSRPLLQSTVMVERRLMETKSLIHDLPCYSEDLLKMVCALLKAYREICQGAYRGIVQPDSEDKRIYSVAWLKDEDISRFLKTLPNWTDLKTSSQRSRSNRKLQRGSFEPSEEESPLQVQQRNIREAEMLTSNLGEGGITQQEILVEISVLKELAILQESMEWFSCRVSEFANDLRRPMVNGLNSVPSECSADVTVKDGTIKVMTNLALEFDELANTCLLVLHLEVRVQCFHYLRSKSSVRTNSYVGSKDDILEPDRQVQVLTKRLSEMDEAFSATLHPRKTRYIFEGLAHLASRILIQASNYLEHIDQITVQRMCRNSIALQQTLSNITASREVALDQAKNFYELLCMEPDEILNALLERGTQFSEMQLLNALHLSCKAYSITDANLLASYQQKLSDILGAKPSKGVVV
ncbi:blast:Exocyst complex component 4 [Drosophila guanche]|uniref:Exocyst complex component Sec8 n=1 Tax=Drosophila guanche TaxID=7266 RepID=A0A3B0JLP9_DROGU|nr:blast:Exocyst complex component 4 [Drosophila guanche]